MPEDADNLAVVPGDTGAEQSSAPAAEATAPVEASTPPEANAQDALPAQAEPTTPANESLKTPNSQNTTTEPEVDWKKRYSDLMSHTSKQTNEWKQRIDQQGQQMSELAKWKQEQEKRASAAALKPWSKAHPENAKFGGLLERAKVVEQQLRRIPATLPPEQQEQMKQAIIGALAPEEQQQIQDYRDSLQNFQREFFTDPQGTLLPMVEQLAEQKVQAVIQRMEAQQSVQRDFADPALAPLVQKYGQDLSKALNDGVPYDYSVHMLKMHAELETLRGQVKGMSGKAAQADEQRRLAKGEASITRDPRATEQDPYMLAKTEAAKRGISTSSKQFIDLLNKYTK